MHQQKPKSVCCHCVCSATLPSGERLYSEPPEDLMHGEQSPSPPGMEPTGDEGERDDRQDTVVVSLAEGLAAGGSERPSKSQESTSSEVTIACFKNYSGLPSCNYYNCAWHIIVAIFSQQKLINSFSPLQHVCWPCV